MKSSLDHLQINISDAKKSLPFYKDLFAYLEYTIIDESESHIGVSNGSTDLWIIETDAAISHPSFHRKHAGLNHVAFKVESKADIDLFLKDFLQPRGIETLYDSPKGYPEYSADYYALYFEDPDRIKLEIVYK